MADGVTFVHVSKVPRHPGDRIQTYDLPSRIAHIWNPLFQATNNATSFQQAFHALEADPRTQKDVSSVAIEVVLEVVRRETYGHLPSRQDSAFACGSRLDALRFSYHYRLTNTNLYYEVSPSEDHWFADMAYTNRGYECENAPPAALQHQRSRAAIYWQSVTQTDHPNFILREVLMPGGATVVRAATGMVGPC